MRMADKPGMDKVSNPKQLRAMQQAKQQNENAPTLVLDAAVELLGAYQIQFGIGAINLNRLANGDIEVWMVPYAGQGGAKILYGRIDKFTKRFVRAADPVKP